MHRGLKRPPPRPTSRGSAGGAVRVAESARPAPGHPNTKGDNMPPKLSWADIEDLGILLHERFPDVDPLTVRFTDLHRWISELEAFGDDPAASNEAKLEAVQMAWLAEYRDAQGA